MSDKKLPPSVWDDETPAPESAPRVTKKETTATKPVKPEVRTVSTELKFDMEGLMTDFPTAKELERFVYEQTGVVLNLKGRANKLKYQVAMDTLNGTIPPVELLGDENPYVDKADMVPEEPLKPIPERDRSLPPLGEVQNYFHSKFVPHPDPDMRAMDAKVTVCFRKYQNGMISYEVEGPLERRNRGEKLDKFGRIRPEIVVWLDPRTGEQLMQRTDGSLSPQGKKLKALMQKHRVWEQWIDREFASLNQAVLDNPWA
jgi:hypothetical protein